MMELKEKCVCIKFFVGKNDAEDFEMLKVAVRERTMGKPLAFKSGVNILKTMRATESNKQNR